MVTEIYLNEYKLNVTNYYEETKNHLLLVKVEFKVSSEDYHDITTLLYKGNFDLKVPERNIACKVIIQEYSTSITNLYEKDQVGDFTLTLLETRV
ncbi:DUF3219 family protein [Fredinandcohnia sp. QZ13]|uniref:DUF3219 family protein n=1 Tax=Fredinandcohnia sp. QZ13 TaxID=3073144 RepID=UPI0028530BA0|nr:DUF3219 family protein [Fredinandcohnia sp. QZ13]MDR4886243.1 DUF3219 family protein [Fredinandcohnia sp. QZ13]